MPLNAAYGARIIGEIVDLAWLSNIEVLSFDWNDATVSLEVDDPGKRIMLMGLIGVGAGDYTHFTWDECSDGPLRHGVGAPLRRDLIPPMQVEIWGYTPSQEAAA